MLVYYAVTLLILSDSQTLNLTKPLWTIIFGIIFYGEKLSLLLCLSILFFIAGILCVVRPAFVFGTNTEP
jgi:drug/metabolite transporter (DMT)-like permease